MTNFEMSSVTAGLLWVFLRPVLIVDIRYPGVAATGGAGRAIVGSLLADLKQEIGVTLFLCLVITGKDRI